MWCNCCEQFHNRIDDFAILDGEVICKRAYEGFLESQDIEPIWFSGWTNEAGEVYGG